MSQGRNPNLILGVLYGAAFVSAFNENVINVALLDIVAQFGVDAVTAQWLVTGYMIVASIMVATMSFLFRRFNLRPLFFTAGAIFIAGCLGGLLAPTFELLLAFRLLQAVGTGMFVPSMMNTVLIVSPRAKLGTYLSIGTCCITLGPAFGPVLSGAMVVALGWRAVFLPPLVVMIVLVLLGVGMLKNVAEPTRPKLDALSEVLLAAGLTVIVFGLTQVTSAPIVGLVMLVVGVAIIVLFGWRQMHLSEPMMNIRPIFNPRFSISCVLTVVAMMTTFSMSVLLPLYFQGALGYSALVAGALILIPIVFNAVLALIGGRVMDSKGEWPLLPVGFLLIVVGQAVVCFTSQSFNIVLVVAASAVVYSGVGLVFSPSQTAGLKTLAREENPHGVGMMNTFIQVAGALGPSLFVGVYSSGVAASVLGGAAEQVSQAAGFSQAVFVAAVVAVVACVISFFYARSAAKATQESALTRSKESRCANNEVSSVDITARDLMAEQVFTVSDDATMRDAMTVMNECHTSGLPVVARTGKVVGFVSTGDVIQALGDKDTAAESLSFMYRVTYDQPEFKERLENVMAANVMEYATDHVVSISPDATVGEVCAVLGKHRVKKVPVVEGGKLVGMISRADVARRVMVDLV